MKQKTSPVYSIMLSYTMSWKLTIIIMQGSQKIVVESKIALRRVMWMITDTRQTLHADGLTRLLWLKRDKEMVWQMAVKSHVGRRRETENEVVWCLRCLSSSECVISQYLQLYNLSLSCLEPHRQLSLAFPCFYAGTIGLMSPHLQSPMMLCRFSWQAKATDRNTPVQPSSLLFCWF